MCRPSSGAVRVTLTGVTERGPSAPINSSSCPIRVLNVPGVGQLKLPRPVVYREGVTNGLGRGNGLAGGNGLGGGRIALLDAMVVVLLDMAIDLVTGGGFGTVSSASEASAAAAAAVALAAETLTTDTTDTSRVGAGAGGGSGSLSGVDGGEDVDGGKVTTVQSDLLTSRRIGGTNLLVGSANIVGLGIGEDEHGDEPGSLPGAMSRSSIFLLTFRMPVYRSRNKAGGVINPRV